jgi:cytochrome P450
METTLTLTRADQARAVLTDPRFAVPPLLPDTATGRLGWLRATVSRFSTGEAHARRRRYAETTLDRIDPAALRQRATAHATGLVRAGVPVDALGRRVPVAVLAAALGVPEPVPDRLVDSVATAARGYHPGTDAGPDGDAAVAYLVRVFGGVPDERTAAVIGLMIQAYDATAALITKALHRDGGGSAGSGLSTDALIEETLREDPPVRALRRVCVAPARLAGADIAAGTTVVLDVAAASTGAAADPAHGGEPLTFGGGHRPCPGRAHARALAAGVIEAVRP